MNKYQKAVVILAAANVALMLLFPPALESPLSRGVLPSFDGFVPFFSLSPGQRVDSTLLALELGFVAVNALVAGLALTGAREIPLSRYSLGIAGFAAGNLALVLLFPPCSSYSQILRGAAAEFDGFHFLFGDRSSAAIYAPILYMELTLVGANALAAWIVFSAIAKRVPPGEAGIMELARDMSPDELVHVSKELLKRSIGSLRTQAPLDRRVRQDPAYRGRERRAGGERRQRRR